jgi:hypothetical protein
MARFKGAILVSLPPTSFRYPFQLDQEGIHPVVAAAIRYGFSGLLDAQNAIAALSARGTVASATTMTEQVSGGGSGTITANVGGVNNQSGNTSYSLVQSDFGALIICDVNSPFALTVSNAVDAPFYAVIENLGTANVVITPATGNINNQSSWSLIPDQSGLIYFDGTSWWVTTLPAYLLGGYSGTGAVVLDSGASVSNETMTGTTSIAGLTVYANNAAARAAGLVTGNLYRDGGNPDHVCVVD